MLDNQDLLKIEEILDGKTSDIRQNVSNLQQNVSVLQQDVSVLKKDVSVLKEDMREVKVEVRKLGVSFDQMKDMIQLVYEGVTQNSKNSEKVPGVEVTLKDHNKRIVLLEKAVKRKKLA